MSKVKVIRSVTCQNKNFYDIGQKDTAINTIAWKPARPDKIRPVTPKTAYTVQSTDKRMSILRVLTLETAVTWHRWILMRPNGLSSGTSWQIFVYRSKRCFWKPYVKVCLYYVITVISFFVCCLRIKLGCRYLRLHFQCENGKWLLPEGPITCRLRCSFVVSSCT